MMLIDNESLELMQGPTRNKADLLYALDHLPPVIPYKWEADSFNEERFNQSLDALQQIALQNKGAPGREEHHLGGAWQSQLQHHPHDLPGSARNRAIYARHHQPAARFPDKPLPSLTPV